MIETDKPTIQTDSAENNNKNVSKSFFCTFANPEEHGFEGTPEQIVDRIIETYPPEVLYQEMIDRNRKIDTYEQLRRRISYLVS